jgi:signal transduction histidine kinase
VNGELEILKERYIQLELLYQVSNVIHSTLDPQEALNLILREAVRMTEASSGSVVLINPTSGMLEIQASLGLPEDIFRLKLAVGEGITGWVARTGTPARVGDVTTDPRYVLVRPEAQSELAVPLRVGDEIRGVLNVDSDRHDAFSPGDQDLMEEFAIQATKVIQNTWLYEQLRLRARMFESLASVGQTINSTINLDEGLRVIAREACTLMGSKVCALHMLDKGREWLELKAGYGAGDAYVQKPRLSAEESLLGVVVRRKKPVQVDNVQTSSLYQNVEIARQEGLISLLSVPLLFAGEAIGTLSVYQDSLYTFSNEEVRVLCALAELSAIAIEKARLYERMVDAEEQLRQNEKLSALGLLAAEVAHEIRNPLTVMKMLYHSLNLDFPESDPRSKDARIMSEKMDQLNRIVERILNFARKAEPKLGLINLNDLISNLSLLSRHKLRNQNVHLLLTLDPNLPPFLGDAMQLEQAFLNLTLNAAQAMPQGGDLTITTRIQTETRHGLDLCPHLVVDFKDTGEGMSEAQCQGAFTSLLSTTKRDGTGLGLAIVSRVVEIHGGQIKVKSRPGTGTIISVWLPMQDADEKR